MTPPTTTTMSSISLKPHHHILPNNPMKPLSFHFIKNPNLSPLPFNTHDSNSLRLHQFSSFPSKFYRHNQHFRRRAYDSRAPGQKVGLDSDFDFDYLLSVGELVCLVSSAVVSVIFAVKRKVFGAMGDSVLVVVVAMLALGAGFGAWVRKRQWRRLFRESMRASGGGGLNLVGRVEKLEEDLRNSATMIRVLSRQLEKLGIRFRVTRKALKEPIAETAALAQKNSEATRALAIQEDILEKELGEIQKVLLAMQEQQQKQLELILAIGKTGKLWESPRGPDQGETNELYRWAEDGVKQTEIHRTPASSVSKVSENDMA